MPILILTGCTSTKEKEIVTTKEVPVEVIVPVATPCVYTVRTMERPKELAIDLINDTTPMDKDVDYWKAYSLQLIAYITGLEASVKDRDEALKVCSDAS